MLQCPTIETVIVVQHTKNEIEVFWLSGKRNILRKTHRRRTSWMWMWTHGCRRSIIHTVHIRSTGKPKEYFTPQRIHGWSAATLKNIFDIQKRWPVVVHRWHRMDHSHSYVIYGPLLLGTTTVVYEEHRLPRPRRMVENSWEICITKILHSTYSIRHLMSLETNTQTYTTFHHLRYSEQLRNQ